jgi:hypothetical protein
VDKIRPALRLKFAARFIVAAVAIFPLPGILRAQTPAPPPVMMETACSLSAGPARLGRVEQDYALVDRVAIDGKFGSGQSKLWAELLSANNRYSDQGTVYILVNLSKAEPTVSLPSAMSDVLEGGSKQSIKLPVYAWRCCREHADCRPERSGSFAIRSSHAVEGPPKQIDRRNTTSPSRQVTV